MGRRNRCWWLGVLWGLLLLGGIAGADEGDWPRFRGPNGEGISTAKTVPVEWTEQGEVSCLRAGTGEFLWQGRIREDFFGSPVWVEGRLYCISRKGVVYVVAAGEGAFKILARNALGERTHATPAVGRGVMYLRTETHLMALGGPR